MMISLADPLPLQRFHRAFFIIFSVLFLVAPLYYQDNPGGEGLFLPFNNAVWIAASFLIALGLLKFSYTRVLLLPKMTAAILFFLTVTTLVGAIGTVSTPTSWLFRSLSIWGGMLLFFSCAQFQLNRRQRDNLLYLLLGSTVIQSLYCLVHLLALDSPPGWMSQSPGIPRGIFQQQNLAASYIATGLLIGLFLSTLPSYRQRHWLLKSMLLGGIALNSLIIITSGSRTGLVAAILGVMLMLATRHRQLLKSGARSFTPILLALVVGSGLGYQIESKTGGVQAGLDKLSQTSQSSTDPTRNDVRIMMYDSSWELFLEKPIFGYGIGQFQPVWHDKKAQYLADNPHSAILEPRLSHPHNELMYWAVEGGLVALSGILVLGLAFLKVCANLGWQRGGAYLVLLLPITLHTQVELPFYISQLHWLLFVVLIALVASHRIKRQPVPLSQMARATMLALSISLPVLASIFFVHSLLSNRISLDFVIHPVKDIRKLDYPSRNIYYNENSEFLRMQTLVQYGLKNNNMEVLKDYIVWAQQTLKQTPDAAIFAGLTFALHKTGEYQQSYAVLRRGLSIYPTTGLMLSAKRTVQLLDRDAGLKVGVP
ncbi:MAG: Wzy polymerase domain-containing protein [Halopseudomonas sp.]